MALSISPTRRSSDLHGGDGGRAAVHQPVRGHRGAMDLVLFRALERVQLGAERCRKRDVRRRDASRRARELGDRKSTRLNSSHSSIAYAVFCLKIKNLNLLAEIAKPGGFLQHPTLS